MDRLRALALYAWLRVEHVVVERPYYLVARWTPQSIDRAVDHYFDWSYDHVTRPLYAPLEDTYEVCVSPRLTHFCLLTLQPWSD